MTWIAYFAYYFLLLRFLVSLSNLFTRQWLAPSAACRYTNASRQSLVSVLVPARNEENNICNLLDDLSLQNYKNLEILVYDDLSEDDTGSQVKNCIKKDNRIKLIEGKNLPAKWLGKNHACHQLALNARGDYLVFVDADVRMKPGMIMNGLAHLERYNLDLLSVFPVQKMHTFAEKITVPVMNWILTGLLPLILTRKSSRHSLSAANGQFMLFRAETYHKHKFHAIHRNSFVEDIGIVRTMKKKRLPVHTVLSNGDISCRMYNSCKDAITGFSRSVTEYFGGHLSIAILFAAVTTLGFIPVFLVLPSFYQFTFGAMLILHRTVISALSRQPVLQNLFLAPLQQLSFIAMIISAIRHKLNYELNWKGRNVYHTDIQTRSIIKT